MLIIITLSVAVVDTITPKTLRKTQNERTQPAYKAY